MLIQEGARVVLAGRRKEVLAEAAEALGAHALACDVSDEEQVGRLFVESCEHLGGLDLLVNNAAFGYRAPLVEQDRQRFEEVFATNVTGAMLCGRAAARRMIEQGQGGDILNIASTAARRGYPGGSAYAASKFALAGLTECWRAELRPHDIRVMQLNPSEVQTPFGGRDMSVPANPTKLMAEDVAHLARALLTLNDRGFVTETTLWATNPQG